MKKYKIKRPIIWKLILSIGIPLLIVYGVILYFNYHWSKEEALQQTKSYMQELTGHYAAKLNTDFTQIAQAPTILAKFCETMEKPSQTDIEKLLKKLIEDNPYVYGLTLAFEPYAFKQDRKLVAPYVFKGKDGIVIQDMSEFSDYTYADWYTIPKLLGKPFWTEPYYQKSNGHVLMCSYSVPVFTNGKLAAIASVNISLEDIRRRMKNIDIMEGYTFLISQYGTYVYHPNDKDVMKETIFSKAEKFNLPEMREFGREMLKGISNVSSFPDPIKGYRQWMVYSPVESTGWTLSAVIPEVDILAAVNAIVIKHLGLMIIGFFVIILIIIWAAFNITHPIRKLVGMAEELATGNLEVQMEEITGKDEIHELAMVFNKMVIDLKHYINDLTAATKEKESVESELRIARNIQESLIPRIFPPFPDRTEFALFARNIPAKEVAGDFYDFFFLDEDNLVTIIADVSGKGVSASLFMAVTKTLIKAKASEVHLPHQIMKEVNQDLCIDNDSAMFCTTFIAIFNVKTGEFNYCNAGHNPPYLIKPGGKISQLENTEGMALGVWEDCDYTCKKIKLEKEDIIYLYTDGVNEAMDINDNEFSYERMEDFLKKATDETPRQLTEKTLKTVKEFTGDAEQSDDITLMVIKYLI
ncbi:MAG: SpoIIE family protein phosphatase [Candidatus Cloacimonetes bacterium]|nr:SpoIIE family protein phosphatase [Candidatus Cloacimonadota bacterium]MCF7813798.1 SpoIIE family protein phosphatase [Candidatus Cloacimonadota bacterium]MCF7868477.1 SpoIIE family protein phosphatase [Candidatus Cloacimonadota bacterium]